MNKHRISLIVIAGIALFCFIAADSARGQLEMTLHGTTDSPIVNFTLSGFDVASDSFALAGIGFDVTDGFDPFPPGVNGADFGKFAIQIGAATVTNGNSTLDISHLSFQDSSMLDTVDRFGAGVEGFFSVAPGNTVSWSGTGTIDLSEKGLTFSDLNSGMGVGEMNFPGLGAVLNGKLIVTSIGDVNCDGAVDLLDVEPFVTLVTNGQFDAKADINQDGSVNLLDVEPFVGLLTN